MLDVDQLALQEDDVVVMATDGLWDVLSNEQVALLVRSFLTSNQKDDPHRYCVAEGDLTGPGLVLATVAEGDLTVATAPCSYSCEDY